MGFLFHFVRLPTAITGAFILKLWSSYLKLLAIGALAHLGLYKPPPGEEDDSTGVNSNNHIFIFEPTCPSLVPIPIHLVTAAIKTKLPVLQFQDLHLLQQGGAKYTSIQENICTICLDPIDLQHEVRQLCRCTHVFHRGCLDTWVDSGQVTCPLCRSMLLPPKTNLTRSRCALAAPVVDNAPPITSWPLFSISWTSSSSHMPHGDGRMGGWGDLRCVIIIT